MKVNIVNENKKTEFKPVTIELTIETKEELEELWHRTNFCSNPYKRKWTDRGITALWRTLHSASTNIPDFDYNVN